MLPPYPSAPFFRRTLCVFVLTQQFCVEYGVIDFEDFDNSIRPSKVCTRHSFISFFKEATLQKYYDQPHQHLQEHLQAFLMAYRFVNHLKTLKELTPYEYSAQCWQREPERSTMNPYHHTLGLNT